MNLRKYPFFCLYLPALALALFPLFTACAPTQTTLPPVSEFLSQIYVSESQGFSAEISFSEREYPYAPDGVCGELCSVLELSLRAPDNTATYCFQLTLDRQTLEGDLHFNDVEKRFFFSCSASPPCDKALSLTVFDPLSPKTSVQLTALPAQKNTPSAKDLLTPLFSELSAPFDGEVYVRLLYRPTVCYFVELIAKDGSRRSFLIDQTGKVQGGKPPL